MKYRIGKSLITIYLPEPIIDSQVPNLDSAKVFNLNEQYVTALKESYETVVPNVESSLIQARQDALIRAEAKGIREETRRLHKLFYRPDLRSICGHLLSGDNNQMAFASGLM